MKTKICKVCKVEKDIELFASGNSGVNTFRKRIGKKPYCKECAAKLAKEYRDAHPGLWKKYKNSKSKVTKYPKEERLLLSAIRTRIGEAKQNNKRNPERKFNIDEDYMYSLWKLQQGKCYLTGADLSLEKQQLNSLSIDKLIPELGYTKGNVRWCSWAANRAKGDMPFEIFHSMCRKILEKCNDYRKEDGTYSIPLILS